MASPSLPHRSQTRPRGTRRPQSSCSATRTPPAACREASAAAVRPPHPESYPLPPQLSLPLPLPLPLLPPRCLPQPLLLGATTRLTGAGLGPAKFHSPTLLLQCRQEIATEALLMRFRGGGGAAGGCCCCCSPLTCFCLLCPPCFTPRCSRLYCPAGTCCTAPPAVGEEAEAPSAASSLLTCIRQGMEGGGGRVSRRFQSSATPTLAATHFHTSMSQPSSASRHARCSWPPGMAMTGLTARRNAAGFEEATCLKAPVLISGRSQRSVWEEGEERAPLLAMHPPPTNLLAMHTPPSRFSTHLSHLPIHLPIHTEKLTSSLCTLCSQQANSPRLVTSPDAPLPPSLPPLSCAAVSCPSSQRCTNKLFAQRTYREGQGRG